MPRILMMEGNTLATQRRAAELGVRSASEVYKIALLSHFPELAIDVLNAADRGQSLRPGVAFEDYDGLVVSGSALRAYDQDFAVTNQIEILRSFGETGRPILGSCWGLQIAVIASGGEVRVSQNGREFGIARKITLTEAGRGHPFFRGKPICFDAPCIHYDEISSLPSEATLLCSNHHSEVQAAIVPVGASDVWAVQYHPEFDLQQLSMLTTLYGDDLVDQGFFENDRDRLSYKEKIDSLQSNRNNKSAAWQLGIDDDILDDNKRRAEIINWVNVCIYRK